MSDERSKNWVFIGYPDSMPKDWETKLRDMKIDIAVSPLHNKDVNPDGEPKKPHYHIILKYSSNKSKEQVKKDIEVFNSPSPEKVKSMKGQVRYLVHIDNPEKAQYSQEDILVIGGWDIMQYFVLTQADRHNHIADMMDFVDENGITEFNALLRYARKNRRDDWFPLLCDNSAYVMDKYICSIRNEKKDEQQTPKATETELRTVKELMRKLYGENDTK